MTGLADVDEFKICNQVCVWLDSPPLTVVCQKNSLYGLVTSIIVAKYMSQHKQNTQQDNFLLVCGN